MNGAVTLNHKLKITFLSKHGLNTGSSILRCGHSVEYLRSLGHDVSMHVIDRYVPLHADMVVLHRVIADDYTISLIKYLKRSGSLVIYDCDDLLVDDDGGQYLCCIGKRNEISCNYLERRCCGAI